MSTVTSNVKYPGIRDYSFFRILFLIIFIQTTPSCSQKNESENIYFKKKNLIVDLIDPSGTAIGAGWPNPSVQFYSDQILFLENNGGGRLIVYNTSLKIPQELMVEIDALLVVPSVIEFGEEQVREIMRINDSARLRNAKAKLKFLSSLDSFIIKFDPKALPYGDLSFINANLYAVIKKIKEPAFAQYDRYLFTYTDFLDESGKGIKEPADSSLINQLNAAGCDIASCTLLPRSAENIAIRQLRAVQLSSYEDYISHLNSFIVKN